MRKAFTLIEVLAAIAIIAILMAIVSPMILSAKAASLRTVDLSNLRQLGQAYAIYSERSGAPPLGTAPLIDTGLIPKDLVSSPTDKTDVGHANRIVKEYSADLPQYAKKIRPYRSSYVGFWEYGWQLSRFEKYIVDAPGGGWLVSLMDSKSTMKDNSFAGSLKGRYLRLRLDGSVGSYEHRNVVDNDGMHETVYGHPIFRYRDCDDKWMRDFFRNPH